jgi:hypothetical protein
MEVILLPTRSDLQGLSEARLDAIKSLLGSGHYDIVCQDSGYVIEYGLKSAVCKHLNDDDYPEHIRKYRDHDFNKLIELADLQNELSRARMDNFNFFVNWSLLTKWSVNFRYKPVGTNQKHHAEEIINAIDNEKDGVHPWVKIHW